VLIPGMGNDGSVVDMYESGYRNLTAFDYAPAGIDCARRLLGENRMRTEITSPGVTLLVADARNLPFEHSSFDAVLDKGTLDAIYLSGGRDKALGARYLDMTVKELARVVVEGGVVVSITAACVDAVQNAFHNSTDYWTCIRDGCPYITEDGYASNNVDGTLLAWKRTTYS
jgi:ubiquinone/menaquinone biosynthesis C-methylase UbiE